MTCRALFCCLIAKLRASTGFRRQLAAFVAGALTTLALAPFNFLPICFFTFPVLIFLLDGVYSSQEGRHGYRLAALTGWSFGFGYFVAGLWWLASAMFIDLAAYGWTIPFAIFGLPAVLALFFALATFIQAAVCRLGYGRIVALGFAFGIAEWLRGSLLTGFPWNEVGYLAMSIPLLMQSSAVIGLYGVNALAVMVFATPALLGERGKETTDNRILGFSIAFLLVLFDIGFGLYRLYPLATPEETAAQADHIRVRLIQPSIPQTEKIDDTARLANFNLQLALTSAPTLHNAPLPDLVVWAETSVPYVFEYAPGAARRLGEALQDGQLALVGTVRAERLPGLDPILFNALEVINSRGEIIASADKVHLVPFGEYLPLSDLFSRLGMSAIAQVAGGYTEGLVRQSIPLDNGITLLPLICYEAIFPTEMDYEGASANVIVNISNDAWFGTTPGPWQHFQQARLRAVEQGLSLIRATNNGISAVVDPYGRIIAKLEYNAVGFIDSAVPIMSVPIWYKGPGNSQAFFIFAILLMFSLYLRLFRGR